MGLLVPIVLAAIGTGGVFATIVKLWPERDKLLVETARGLLEELREELERALVKVAALQKQLDAAIERTHELERMLETERKNVAGLERRLAELDHRHP